MTNIRPLEKKATSENTADQPATSSSSLSKTAKSASTANSNKPVAMKKVSIAIAGKNYPINCPVDEEEALRRAVYYINNFVQDIKKEAPHLNQENLLVLCCLNLFEQINEQQESSNSQRLLSEEADSLLSKIIEDAQSIAK